MRRKRSERMRLILCAGDIGIYSGRNITESLQTIRTLLMLRKMGLDLSGGHISLCRVVCDASSFEKIKDRAGKGSGLMILKEADIVEETSSEKPGKRRKRRTTRKELIAAACSNELFFMIDMKPEEFTILPPDEAFAILEKISEANGFGKRRARETISDRGKNEADTDQKECPG